MFRLVRNDTIRKALQQTLSVRRFTQVKSAKNSNTQVYLSTLFKRSLSSTVAKKSNDAVFLAASVGVAGVVGTVLYYTTSSTSAKKSVIISKQEEVEEEEPLVDEVDEIEKDRNEFLKAAVANLPESSPYVIIGAGTTAHAACRAIRTNQPDAKILIIGEEDVLPYMRPPLSKELWFSDSPDAAEKLIFKSWNGKERSVFFEEESYYTPLEEFITKEDGAVSVVSGKKVLSIDAEDHKIQLSSGQSLTYQKLLIATGGTPRNHPAFAETDSNVSRRTTLFRNVSDFRKLDKVLKNKEHVTVVGGGFLGSELACALAAHGKRSGLNVTQVYPEDGNMAKVLPRYLSEWTTKKVNKEGVEIISQQNIKTAKASGKKVELEFINGEKLMTDHVVVCVGLEPNVELSKSAGLEIDPEVGGFRVNSELEARSDIWVAGDAACFFDINLGRRRVEHHDHAVVSGRLAGENMTGAKKSYKHQSMFWSDLGPEVGYEAIGLVDSSLPTVGVWAKASATDTPKAAEEATGESIPSERPDENALAETSSSAESETESQPTGDAEEFGKGVVFYMKEKRIVGILLWNIFSKMPIARKIITEGKDHDNLNEVAKLFHIHKQINKITVKIVSTTRLTKMDGKTDLYPISNVNKIPDASIKILNSTKFSDPKTMDHSKQLKIDALCELTSIMQRKPGHIDIPAPDYNADYNSNGYLQQIEEISGDKEFLGKAYIKKNMSQEMKMISKDIQLRSKQDVQKRPEFLAKQHQMKTSALRKQEDKEKEENNELLTKLKSRSHKIEEVEKEKTTHDNQPEFMKVKLKSQQRPAAVS